MTIAKDTPYRSHWLTARIYSEGYCCLHGYLALCKARGETPSSMAKNIEVPIRTIHHHYRCEKAGNRPCAGKSDCLKPVIEELQKEKAP